MFIDEGFVINEFGACEFEGFHQCFFSLDLLKNGGIRVVNVKNWISCLE